MNAKQIYKAMVNIANDYVGMGREKQACDSAVLDTIMRVYYTDTHIDFEEVKWLWVRYLLTGALNFPAAKQRARERCESKVKITAWKKCCEPYAERG